MSVSVPLVTETWVWIGAAAASGSAIETPNDVDDSSVVAWVPGTVCTGGSLTACAVVVTVAVLFELESSAVAAVIVAVVVSVVSTVAVTSTTMLIAGAAPVASVARVHVTFGAEKLHVQPVPVALTKLVLVASGKVTVAFATVLGPPLFAVTV